MTFMEVETAISCHSNTDAKISSTYQSEEKKGQYQILEL